MSNEKSLAIIPRTVEEVRALAAMFAKSTLLPVDLRGKEADVFVSIMAGQELGLPPMAALRGVHVVKGKPVLSADSMVGVVLGSGIAEYFSCVEESPTSVTYETKRRGAPHEQTCTWTIDDAKRAGLSGDNWQKYPRAMLKARCKAALARDVYPDVLAGCYIDDEAREFSDVPRVGTAPVDAIEAEIVSETPAVDFAALLAQAATVEELKALVPQLNALPKGTDHRANAMDAYKARMSELTKGKAA